MAFELPETEEFCPCGGFVLLPVSLEGGAALLPEPCEIAPAVPTEGCSVWLVLFSASLFVPAESDEAASLLE